MTFDSAGGAATTSSKNVVYGQKYGELPSTNRTGYTFTGWFTEKDAGKGEKVMEDDTVAKGFDHTLYAHWIINNYTLTFDFGNGTVTEIIYKYNDTINYPIVSEREGFVFNGWDKTIKRMPAGNTVITALWLENPLDSWRLCLAKRT